MENKKRRSLYQVIEEYKLKKRLRAIREQIKAYERSVIDKLLEEQNV